MKTILKNEKLIRVLVKSTLPLITLFFLFVKPQKAEAAITFVGANSAVSTATASITVNKPSGTAEGDVMVAQIFI
ncbi:MAG: hypothetical protein KatS3mg087_1501 [Patescibacteria group bacterium]|nr:MAG: hypothetical protein KatS3mg087_1501 [Patescibacteria group bacterium]